MRYDIKWKGTHLRRTGLGWGRKLLTLEMLHMPSRYCCAWMVTVLKDPLSCPPATVTWTLVFGPEDTEGLCDQPGTLCRSPKGSTEWAAGWILDSCFAWTPEDMVNLAGCGKRDVAGRAAMSELTVRMGAWSVCKASRLSWWRDVAHTWQQLTPASLLPGVWSCSNKKDAYPGSCGANGQKREGLTWLHAVDLEHISLSFQRISCMLFTFSRRVSGLQPVWSRTALRDPHSLIQPLPLFWNGCLFRLRCFACMQL